MVQSELEFVPPKKRKGQANKPPKNLQGVEIIKGQFKSETDQPINGVENEMTNFEEKIKTSSTVSFSESSLDDPTRSVESLTPRSGKKRVNITAAVSPTSDQAGSQDDVEAGGAEETSSLQPHASNNNHHYLTMTGTIKRGKKKGQEIDVQLNISREELEKINATTIATIQTPEKTGCCTCALGSGGHIFVLSLLSLPFIFVFTAIYAFYLGTITWHNIFNYFSERNFFLRLIVSPLLVAVYPVAIVTCSLGLGVYGGVKQLSCHFQKWRNEIADVEKGFYGWLCNALHLSDCSPYEVVILNFDLATPAPAAATGTAPQSEL